MGDFKSRPEADRVGGTDVRPYLFSLQPLLLLLQEVFLPLQTLLLRLLPGFSLSFLLLKHTGQNPAGI